MPPGLALVHVPIRRMSDSNRGQVREGPGLAVETVGSSVRRVSPSAREGTQRTDDQEREHVHTRYTILSKIKGIPTH